ncbi:MAG: DUF1178 family protein [Deltaproteobacteria bacterium]|nr:DUF1178 family protein [Deltaproteobacteria bacterium]
MIAFDLLCSQGHVFEGWFTDSQSFEDQIARKLVNCPYCNDANVKRVLSPVAMKTSSQNQETKRIDPIDYHRLAREIVDYVQANFDDVGPDFAKEALKMHYGVSEKKNIRGSATMEEEKTLAEEGIHFFKMPLPKVDDDKKN